MPPETAVQPEIEPSSTFHESNDIPEITTVVMPSGAQLSPEEADRLSVESAQKAAPPAGVRESNLPRRSFFRDDAEYYATTVTFWDEEFYLAEPSDEVQEYAISWQEDTAGKLGITIEQMRNEEFLKKSLSSHQQITLLRESRELQRMVLNDCLKKWTLDRECNEANKLLLPREVKEHITQAALNATEFGEDSARFPGRSG